MTMISSVTLSVDIPPQSLICYVRNNKGERVGVLVAKKIGAGYGIGYSKCRKNEVFNKVLGLNNAFVRADLGILCSSEVPYSMRNAYTKFVQRCRKYYRA